MALDDNFYLREIKSIRPMRLLLRRELSMQRSSVFASVNMECIFLECGFGDSAGEAAGECRTELR